MSWRPRSPLPAGFIAPCQPSECEAPPSGDNWLHEIKHDGYRLMVWREGGRVRLFTRNGHDWAERFPAIVDAALAIESEHFLIDGEVVVAGADGRAAFELLRSGGRVKPSAFLWAFDLILVDREYLRRLPIEERKERLAQLFLAGVGPGLQLNGHIEGDGATVFARACAMGLEGIVSKRKGSHYRSGRSLDWRKSKNPASETVRREATEDWGRSGRR